MEHECCKMIFLFDLDDTLLDDKAAKEYYIPKLYNHFRDRIKLPELEFYITCKEAIPRYYQKFLDGILTFEGQRRERVKESFADIDLPETVIDDVLASFDEFFKGGWKPFPDTIDTLERLKGYKKGIITNGSVKQQNEKIDILGIRKYFDCIIISEEFGITKPDQRLFYKACELLDCTPEECVFTGDSWEVDVKGSHNAGMKPVWLNTYEHTKPTVPEDVLEINEISELLDLIEMD